MTTIQVQYVTKHGPPVMPGSCVNSSALLMETQLQVSIKISKSLIVLLIMGYGKTRKMKYRCPNVFLFTRNYMSG